MTPGCAVSFVTDKIKKGEIKVAFCQTHDMLGDFLTKPLQGNQFVHMRDNLKSTW